MKKDRVDPYEVEGVVDYKQLIKKFGIEKLTQKQIKKIENIAGKSHHMLRRKIFFAGRDLDWLLKQHKEGKEIFIYTGIGPSGPIHIGHLMVWYFAKYLQDAFDAHLYFQFTDDEKFLYKDLEYEEVQKWLAENMKDVAAVGFDPKKTHFIIDTKHADILYPQAIKVAKKITYSQVKSSFGFTDSNNIGSIFYTAMQTVPCFLPSIIKNKQMPCLIPHAVDQDPHFRLSRDVLPKLGHYKPASIQCSFLPPLTGSEGKMSSSKSDKSILSTDLPGQVKKKINKYAFSGGRDSLEEHREKGGDTSVDISYQYLRFMFEEDDDALLDIKKKYESGEMLSGELKQICIAKINTFLKKHQSQRENMSSRIHEFLLK